MHDCTGDIEMEADLRLPGDLSITNTQFSGFLMACNKLVCSFPKVSVFLTLILALKV